MATTKIESVSTLAVRLPRELGNAIGTAGTPNEVVGRGAYRWSKDYAALYPIYVEMGLVKVTLDNGLHGWGEAQAPLAPEVACTIVDRLLRPVLEGCEFDGAVSTIEALWDRMYSCMRVRGQTGGFMLDAISGVDLALWDLAGKLRGMPVARLIAGPAAKTDVPAYVSGLGGPERLATARGFYNLGFRVFKLYYESSWGDLLEQIDQLRTGLGEDVSVAVDALWHMDPARALEMAAELDKRRPLWLECPFMPELIDEHAKLARAMRTPIALGESYRTRYELAPFFAARIMGFVQPDLGRCGITESLRIAAAARESAAAVVPHVSIAMGPQIAAAVHFAAAAPACDLCEYNPTVLEVANRFLSSPLTLKGARWVVPSGPGLGVDIDEARLRRALLVDSPTP